MDEQRLKQRRQLRRRRHVRKGVRGTAERPRLTVFRSGKHIYAQLINDLTGVTLASASSKTAEVSKEVPYGGNIKAAKLVGKRLAEAAKEKGIDKAAFDRGHYRFHGRIKALALAANEAGLKCSDSHRKPKEAPAPKPEKAAKPKKEKGEKPEQGAGKPEKAGKPDKAAAT
jgi:large subunit ribosomal protein L18